MKKIIGQVAVDSGCIWIGDPCYVIDRDKNHPAAIERECAIKNWRDFCNATLDDTNNKVIRESKDFHNFAQGLGISANTHMATECNDVEAEYEKNGELKSIKIIF